MSKFKAKATKRLLLTFLGEDWKDCYIDFVAFTINDVRDKFPAFSEVNTSDTKSVTAGMSNMLELLQEKFVTGKAVNEEGKVVDITAEDLGELPAEVLSQALSFLSLGVIPQTTTSEKP